MNLSSRTRLCRVQPFGTRSCGVCFCPHGRKILNPRTETVGEVVAERPKGAYGVASPLPGLRPDFPRALSADGKAELRAGGRGRDAHYCAPPAQIRTCGFPAYGSYLGCLTAKRCSGQGWTIRTLGR
jgi:hypothetical protein